MPDRDPPISDTEPQDRDRSPEQSRGTDDRTDEPTDPTSRRAYLRAGGGDDISTGETEPSDTEIRTVDDTPVLFRYGKPAPAVETRTRDTPGREYRDLNGTWRFRFGDDGPEPAETGVENGWHRADYDDSDWDEVAVPLPWDLYDTPGFDTTDGDHWGEGTAHRDGYGWYRRTIRVPESWAGRAVSLRFLAASYRARVYVNGEHVADHEGGHTPFTLDVNEHLAYGADNVIAVRVYRREWFEDETSEDAPEARTGDCELPAGSVDYWPYAGLTRDVYLEATAPVTVRKLLADAADGEATLRAVCYNHGDRAATRTVELDPGDGTGGEAVTRSVDIEPGETRVVTATVPIPDAEWWDIDSPVTYEARTTLRAAGGETEADERAVANDPAGDSEDPIRDVLTARYGMRTVDTEGGVVRVNGEQVFLRGFNWHEETATHGRSLTREEHDALLERVTDTDANLLRNSHYNRHPYIYEWADEHGCYVIDEAENMWVPAAQQRRQLDYGLSRALVATTVWNQYNRPSVIMWSTHNECSIDRPQTYREWVKDMQSAVTALDGQDRPVVWANYERDDPAWDRADVIGFNEYFGVFWGENYELGGALDELTAEYPDTPVLVTENGTWSGPSSRGGQLSDPTETGTEAWHVRNFREHWVQVAAPERSEQVAGYTFWVLRDYKTRDGYNRGMNGVSTMGTMNWGDPDLETFGLYDAIREAYGAFPEIGRAHV